MSANEQEFLEREEFLERMGSRFVEVNDGIVLWDGAAFFNEGLKKHSHTIAFKSDGESVDGQKYPVLTCINQTGTRIARPVLKQGSIKRAISGLWRFIKGQ